jgi:site-specific DNA recombinase
MFPKAQASQLLPTPAVERGMERLIDIYTSGLIDKAEFEPRITGQRQRLAQRLN